MYIEKGQVEEGIEKAYEIDEFNIKVLNNLSVYYAEYEKNILMAMENISIAYDIIRENKRENLEIKDKVKLNFSLVKKVYDENIEINNENWNLDNLKYLK